jgi:hypothetical protein
VGSGSEVVAAGRLSESVSGLLGVIVAVASSEGVCSALAVVAAGRLSESVSGLLGVIVAVASSEGACSALAVVVAVASSEGDARSELRFEVSEVVVAVSLGGKNSGPSSGSA